MIDESLKLSDPILYRKLFIEDFATRSKMTPREKAMFMARMDHETGGFKWMKEIGNKDYFSKYDGRKDLGNTEPGDGFRYRGRGFIQLTGRKNYRYFSPIVGADLINYPDIAMREDVAARIAIAYWNKAKVKGGRTIAQAAKDDDIEAVVRGVNGGLNGYRETISLYQQYLNEYE